MTTPYPMYLIGDSITKGRAATWEGLTWREHLAVSLQDAHPDEDVYLETETTFASGWKLADAQTAVNATPPTADSALIVCGIGTNDFDGNQGTSSRTTIAVFKPGYISLINQLHAAAPDALIIGLSVWEVSTSGSNVRSDFDTAIKNAVEAVGGVYVSIIAARDTSSNHGPAGLPEDWYSPGTTTDTFHPNDLGHLAIAKAILSVLT